MTLRTALFTLTAALMLAPAAVAIPAAAQEAKPAAAAAAADPAKLAAARELMQATGVAKQMDDMMEIMKASFAKGAKAENQAVGEKLSNDLNDHMKKFMTYKEEMMGEFAQLYADTFTIEEMKSVTEFYKTGAGAKFIQKTPELMQKGAAIGMRFSQKVMESAKAAAPK